MAINILDTVMENLKGPALEQIGGWLGESPEKTKAAADGMVPALLSKIIDLVSKPGGDKKLSTIFDKTDDSLPGKMGAVLKGGKAAETAASGSNLLTSLFGNNVVTSLISGVAKFAGIDLSSAKSLLGLLVPIVFGALKKLLSSGLSLSWLIKLMLSQKDSLAKALPKGLAALAAPATR